MQKSLNELWEIMNGNMDWNAEPALIRKQVEDFFYEYENEKIGQEIDDNIVDAYIVVLQNIIHQIKREDMVEVKSITLPLHVAKLLGHKMYAFCDYDGNPMPSRILGYPLNIVSHSNKVEVETNVKTVEYHSEANRIYVDEYNRGRLGLGRFGDVGTTDILRLDTPEWHTRVYPTIELLNDRLRLSYDTPYASISNSDSTIIPF